jgi:hypothetical protein
LFNEAVNKLADAEGKERKFDDLIEESQRKLDLLSEREEDIRIREQKLIIREEAVNLEREQIKKLSKELSINLQKL